MGRHEVSREVLLKINGEKIEVNEFVAEFLKGAIRGILRSLKGIPEDMEKVEIIINEDKKG